MRTAETGPYPLACMEVWGGNREVAVPVELPGLAAWVYSKPLEAGSGGGDVHYLSACNAGILSRVALADVSGHGQVVSSLAETLRALMHKHINTWDQSAFMRELNEAFQQTGDANYATGVVLSFHRQLNRLVFTNAGHLPPLWYHAVYKKWDLLEENVAEAETEVAGLPLGVIPGTNYQQTVVELASGDVLLLYTDGLTETKNQAGERLGREELLKLAQSLPLDSPAEAGQALLRAVRAFGQGMPADDETLVVLQRAGM